MLAPARAIPSEPPSSDDVMRGGWNAFRRGDCATALRLLEEAARRAPPDKSSIKAASLVGGIYESGRCPPQDDRKALEYYRLAAAQGDIDASFNVGVVADRLQDYKAAVAAYRQAAEAGMARAQSILGEHYRDGRGVERDAPKAVSWYRRAAEQHDQVGEFMLGYASEVAFGGIPRDMVEAERWYRRAAEQGYPPAQANLGLLLVRGQGIATDYAEATQWFRRAAELQVPYAMASYGYSLERGNGIEKDLDAAIHWYKRAAAYGQPNAMHNLAGLYASGEGVGRDLAESYYWALLAQRFYEPGRKLDSVRRLARQIAPRLDAGTRQSAQDRARDFSPRKPPSYEVPIVRHSAMPLSVREQLRNDPHFHVYSAYFAVTLDGDGEVLSLRPLQVIDPAAGNAPPVDVPLPSSYVDAVRLKLSARRPDGVEPGKRASFVTFFFFSPTYPSSAISDLDATIDEQP